MTTASQKTDDDAPSRLCNGDRMPREDFHLAYCSMPDDYRAELIGGIVFEPSPVSYGHGTVHARLAYLFERYAETTPGTQVADNATLILSDDDEVQPDLMLRVCDAYGGGSRRTDDDYIEGAPELVAEVANSSRAIDLHLKKERYALAGVAEYLVVCLRPQKTFWFDLQVNTTLTAGRDGIFRSIVFPGLWIHKKGLLSLNSQQTGRALKRGIASAAHKRFVAALTSRK